MSSYYQSSKRIVFTVSNTLPEKSELAIVPYHSGVAYSFKNHSSFTALSRKTSPTSSSGGESQPKEEPVVLSVGTGEGYDNDDGSAVGLTILFVFIGVVLVLIIVCSVICFIKKKKAAAARATFRQRNNPTNQRLNRQ
jgi:hypothetical protein